MLTRNHLFGSYILKELRKRGYDGSQMAFYRLLKKIRTEEGKTKAYIHYDTLPGKQGQFDWSPYTPLVVLWSGIVVFSFILGFSCQSATLLS